MSVVLKMNLQEAGYSLPHVQFSVSGGHKIIRTNISKGERGGTIKERWSTDDFKVVFTGVILGTQGQYPKDEVERFLRYARHKGNLLVIAPALDAMGIRNLAVETYQLPHTKGAENQRYSLTAYSDELFNELLVS